jgi:hypothetical protein
MRLGRLGGLLHHLGEVRRSPRNGRYNNLIPTLIGCNRRFGCRSSGVREKKRGKSAEPVAKPAFAAPRVSQ